MVVAAEHCWSCGDEIVADFIDIDVEGEEKIILALERREEEQRGELRRMIDELADFGEAYLYSAVPRGVSHYILAHITREGPGWLPGGVGGGGEWKAIVGISEGESRHPFYVEYGTGIYGGRGWIYPQTASVMRFEKNGEIGNPRSKKDPFGIYRYRIKGQPPQFYFRQTWRVLNAYARARILGHKLF